MSAQSERAVCKAWHVRPKVSALVEYRYKNRQSKHVLGPQKFVWSNGTCRYKARLAKSTTEGTMVPDVAEPSYGKPECYQSGSAGGTYTFSDQVLCRCQQPHMRIHLRGDMRVHEFYSAESKCP